MRDKLIQELKEVRENVGIHMVSDENLNSIIDTCLAAFKEEIKAKADFRENPIETNGELVDGSYYLIYKGQLETLLK
jgi:hypothetical protein